MRRELNRYGAAGTTEPDVQEALLLGAKQLFDARVALLNAWSAEQMAVREAEFLRSQANRRPLRPMHPGSGLHVTTARLVAGILNEHIFTHDGDCPEEDRCCPSCCGPCHSLDEFRISEGKAEWLRLGFREWDGGSGWSWLTADGFIDWAEVERHWWPGPCQEGCER